VVAGASEVHIAVGLGIGRWDASGTLGGVFASVAGGADDSIGAGLGVGGSSARAGLGVLAGGASANESSLALAFAGASAVGAVVGTCGLINNAFVGVGIEASSGIIASAHFFVSSRGIAVGAVRANSASTCGSRSVTREDSATGRGCALGGRELIANTNQNGGGGVGSLHISASRSRRTTFG